MVHSLLGRLYSDREWEALCDRCGKCCYEAREIDGEWRNSNLPLVIGNYTGTKKPYAFDGLLDEVRVYDTALTEDEIVRAAAEGLRR